MNHFQEKKRYIKVSILVKKPRPPISFGTNSLLIVSVVYLL